MYGPAARMKQKVKLKRSNSLPQLHGYNTFALRSDMSKMKSSVIRIILKLNNKLPSVVKFENQPCKIPGYNLKDPIRKITGQHYLVNDIQEDVVKVICMLRDIETLIEDVHGYDGEVKCPPQDEKIPTEDKCSENVTLSSYKLNKPWYSPQNEILNIKSTANKYGLIDFLMTFQCFPKNNITACPVSLTTYFDSLSSGNAISQQESMSNSLLRIASFNNFPRQIDVFVSNLSKAGFYYTGTSDEVRCYACGIRHKKWTPNDDPAKIHKMLSPSCPHVLGSSFDNNTALYLASSVPDSVKSSLNQNTTSVPQQGNSVKRFTEVSTNDTVNNLTTSVSNGSVGTRENINKTASGNFKAISSIGIDFDKPKYPNYASLQVRTSSFQGWPSYLDQTPHQMARAGFLFAGYQDYTRCFFCGIGLRNWEAGDDPWVEHARWFPNCTYLRQNKDEKFIKAVQTRQEQLAEESNQSSARNYPLQTQTTTVNPCPITRAESLQQKSLLNNAAARSVLQMGYTDKQVLRALSGINQSNSRNRQITASDILSILLNEDLNPNFENGDNGPTTGAANNTVNATLSTEKQLFINSSSNSAHCNASFTSDERTVSAPTVEYPTLNETDFLIEENRQLKDRRLCKICLEFDASIAFLPCGHLVCCSDCAPAMRKCPICRAYVKGTVKTFLV